MATTYRHTNPRTAPADAENGPSAADVPTCPNCGRGPIPAMGITFLRPGYRFGDECDRCAKRLLPTPPRLQFKVCSLCRVAEEYAETQRSCGHCGGFLRMATTDDIKRNLPFIGQRAAYSAEAAASAERALLAVASGDGNFDTRPENPAMDEADRYLPEVAGRATADGPVRAGYDGLFAARDLRAQRNQLLTIERCAKPNSLNEFIAKGWLARVTKGAPGGDFEFEREFIKPCETRRQRNGSEHRDYPVFALADGIYEADTVGRDGENKRLYFRVESGRIAVVYRGRSAARAALGIRS